MGLIVKSTQDKKILISGTTIEIPEIYCRVEFAGRMDGITLEVAASFYASKQTFELHQLIYTDIALSTFSVQLQPSEQQTVDTALYYTQQVLTQMGYDAAIEPPSTPLV